MEAKQRTDAEFGVLKATRLEIQATDGTTRIELGTSDRGEAVFRLRDQRGTVRAVVSVQDGSPRVRLLDRYGQVRLCTILRDEQPGIELLGSDGRPRMVIYLREHEDEAPDLYFLDHDGDPRFGIAMDHAGRISLNTIDEAGDLHEPLWSQTEKDAEDEPLY